MNTSEKRFYLDSNGITIKCKNTISGDKGFVDGIEYECVDNELLKIRIKEGSDATRLCTSFVTSMFELFKYSNFNQPIGNWDTENVIDMDRMFKNSQFNQPIGEWNVISVKHMSKMFESSQFNQNIGNWDTDNVKTMESMFRDSQFNQDISHWDVSRIETEPKRFSIGSLLTEENKPVWGTCPD